MATISESLNVVALISGGKDSFYSLLHCIANQHRVVALANLYPPEAASPSDYAEDLNSYMYQTAGHGIIPLYAEALGLPLYRQEITGVAVFNTSRDYYLGSTAQNREDETESLLPLLKRVIAAHPTVNAVCSGAILSTYQRTRIESVTRRLNLIPLSYLWQFPSLVPSSPGGLLDDMAAIGLDVRIVKIASGGLDEDLLWSNLMVPAVRRKVERSLARFGGSVLGEGGEYETLVVDGPIEFWKGRIEVQDDEKFIGRGGGGEAWIGFRHGAGKVEEKVGAKSTGNDGWKTLIRPVRLWDLQFQTLIAKPMPTQERTITEYNDKKPSNVRNIYELKPVIVENGSKLVLSNITAVESGHSASEQMLGINRKLRNILSEYATCTADDVLFTTILLRSMTDFAAVNSIYERLFTLPNPPARVTVACGDTLPERVCLMVSFSLDLGTPRARQGLHVQSRSYWAPANIGPYSQAIAVPLFKERGSSLVYVAGQIPLVPASMNVYQGERTEGVERASSSQGIFFEQTCLALQHLWRIGRAMNVGWWTVGVAFITGRADMQTKAEIAWEIWNRVHERQLWGEFEEHEDELDVWDRVYGGRGTLGKDRARIQLLPDFARYSHIASCGIPGFFAIEVDELPRGCDIEWQSLGIAHQEDTTTSSVENPISLIEIELDQELRPKILELFEGAKLTQKVDATVYTANLAFISDLDVQIIPSRRLWGPRGRQLAGAIVLQNHSNSNC